MSTTQYVPVNTTTGKVGPLFDFESVATMWIIAQQDPQNWTVQPVAGQPLLIAA